MSNEDAVPIIMEAMGYVHSVNMGVITGVALSVTCLGVAAVKGAIPFSVVRTVGLTAF